MKLIILTIVFVSLLALNDKPIIGILTIPSDVKEFDGKDYSYIGAAYVKFIEMGGGRVIPISYRANTDEIDKILS